MLLFLAFSLVKIYIFAFFLRLGEWCHVCMSRFQYENESHVTPRSDTNTNNNGGPMETSIAHCLTVQQMYMLHYTAYSVGNTYHDCTYNADRDFLFSVSLCQTDQQWHPRNLSTGVLLLHLLPYQYQFAGDQLAVSKERTHTVTKQWGPCNLYGGWFQTCQSQNYKDSKLWNKTHLVMNLSLNIMVFSISFEPEMSSFH